MGWWMDFSYKSECVWYYLEGYVKEFMILDGSLGCLVWVLSINYGWWGRNIVNINNFL